MDSSPNLTLPYIIAAQAQKHVTHKHMISSVKSPLTSCFHSVIWYYGRHNLVLEHQKSISNANTLIQHMNIAICTSKNMF
jgi:hypothetical protein